MSLVTACSVPFRKCCHLKRIRKYEELLHHTLQFITNMFWTKSVTQTMKPDGPHESGLARSRFGTILFIFRLAGIPLNTQSVSPVRSAYNTAIVLCFYITCLSCLMDILVNNNNLEELMKTIRVFFPMILDILIHIFFRYVKSTFSVFC
jgi:hypothetical protein